MKQHNLEFLVDTLKVGNYGTPYCEYCCNALECGELSWKDFKIMNHCRSNLECKVKEAFLIKKLSPPLNRQLHQDGALVTLKVFG